MTDIADQVLAGQLRIHSLFAALDAARSDDDQRRPQALVRVWAELAALLELYTEAASEIWYPQLLSSGRSPDLIEDLLADAEDIREAVQEARLCDPGGPAWWRAVRAARDDSAAHFARQERELLAARGRLPPQALEVLGRQWSGFVAARARDLCEQAGRDRAGRRA